MLATLTAAADGAGLAGWSLSVDSTIARAHQHATNTKRLTGGLDHITRILASNRLITRSVALGVVCRRRSISSAMATASRWPALLTVGQAGDWPMFLPLMSHLRVARAIGRPRTRPVALCGDKAYSSRAIGGYLRARGIWAMIPEPKDQQGHRKQRGSHGGRPMRWDEIDYRNRNVIERCYCHITQWRGLATRYDKQAIIYRAAIILWRRHRMDPPFIRHALASTLWVARTHSLRMVNLSLARGPFCWGM